MSHARAEDGQTVELLPDTDNWPLLQPFLDAHTAVQLPAGVWPLFKTLQIGNAAKQLSGLGQEQTTLRLLGGWKGPVVGVGGNGRWDGSAGYGAANGSTLRGLTLWQKADDVDAEKSANKKGLFIEAGDDMTVDRVRVQGSNYEGIIGSPFRLTLRNIEAWDCGCGGLAYTLSTAGINATGVDFLLEDFRTLRCGQGVETGNTRVTVRRGVISTPGVTPGPVLGINVGSSGQGVYQTTISDCVIDGYDAAIQVGNGLGRLAAVFIKRNIIYDLAPAAAAVTFQGGLHTNNVPTPDQGPDTEGSEISDNILHVATPHNGAIQYVSGINLSDSVFGREPLLVLRNQVFFTGDPSLQTSPVFGFAGNISGACVVLDNVIDGLPAAPSRGDVASFGLIDNPTIPGMPNLSVYRNRATYQGAARPLSVKIEGA